MGKLHTLRRAILRDPERWGRYYGAYYNRRKQCWMPSFWQRPYRKFVQHVLKTRGLGSADDGAGVVAPAATCRVSVPAQSKAGLSRPTNAGSIPVPLSFTEPTKED